MNVVYFEVVYCYLYYYTQISTDLSTYARKHVHESYRSYQLANMHVCADDPV